MRSVEDEEKEEEEDKVEENWGRGRWIEEGLIEGNWPYTRIHAIWSDVQSRYFATLNLQCFTFDHHSIIVNAPTLGARIRFALVFPVASVWITNRFSPVRLVYPTPHLARCLHSWVARKVIAITSGIVTRILSTLSELIDWIT